MATDLDVDGARKVGVAVPPESKDEYAEAANQLQPGFVATVDGTDPSLGWTVQQRIADREMADEGEAEVSEFTDPGDTLPGQVYLPEQLPDPQLAIQAGIPPVKVPEHLITDNPDHIQGPEPSELVILEHRRNLRRSVMRHRSGEAYAGIADGEETAAPGAVVGASNDGGGAKGAPTAKGDTAKASAAAPAGDQGAAPTT